MKKWTQILPVKPYGKGRPRAGKGRIYTPKKTLDAESDVALWLRAYQAPKLSGALYLELVFFFKLPKSAKNRRHHTVKPDADNLLKLFMDSANGILFDDDKQVVKAVVEKRYAEKEGIAVTISEVD